MLALRNTMDDFLHIFFPHVCSGCGNDIIGKNAVLCIQCLEKLPVTNFHFHRENQVEKVFRGRIPVEAASSFLYFSKDSLVQRLLHQIKYKGNHELGYVLGRMMGEELKKSDRFQMVDVLLPLPLHASKEKERGYNQAMVLCAGISHAMNLPVCSNAVRKVQYTETQTHKNRIERWQNMEAMFELVNREEIQHKHVLLVDDVITTGATLEACGHELLQAANLRLSIATLAYAVK